MKGGLLSDSRWVGCTESGCECPIFFFVDYSLYQSKNVVAADLLYI